MSIQLYGHPWVTGEYWPMITPCFQVRAVDDAGNEHEGMPGDWQGFPATRASGRFLCTIAPLIHPQARIHPAKVPIIVLASE